MYVCIVCKYIYTSIVNKFVYVSMTTNDSLEQYICICMHVCLEN